MYRRQIRESMKGDFPYIIELLFAEDVIELESKSSHRTFSVHSVKCIIETGEYFYITGEQMCIIIPKSQIPEFDTFQSWMDTYEESLKIPYVQQIDWKWS